MGEPIRATKNTKKQRGEAKAADTVMVLDMDNVELTHHHHGGSSNVQETGRRQKKSSCCANMAGPNQQRRHFTTYGASDKQPARVFTLTLSGSGEAVFGLPVLKQLCVVNWSRRKRRTSLCRRYGLSWTISNANRLGTGTRINNTKAGAREKGLAF